MSTAFSGKMLKAQAGFVAEAVIYINKNITGPIHMFGHSMGGVVNMLASTMPNFPIQ